MRKIIFATLALAAFAALAAPSATAATAAPSCEEQWKSMKANNTVPAGEKKKDFMAQCNGQQGNAAAGSATTTAAAGAGASCEDQWKMMKANNTVPAGEKKKDFMAQCNGQQGAAPAAPAVKTAAPAAPAAPAATATAAPTQMPTATPSGACTMQYDLLLVLRKLPNNETKDDFMRSCMSKPAATTTTTTTTTTTAAKPAPVPVEPKGAATGGQAGEISRIDACAKEWHQMKAANQIPVGTKWPQFWSECDKQLKAQGL